MKVRFPDGTVVQARGGRSGRVPHNDHDPADYALYLDKQWAKRKDVAWPHTLIDWPDFRLPRDEGALFVAIDDAWLRAKDGQVVEIACAGGIGRTGTVLACMAVLGGVAPDQAVAWIRANYHRHAVETRSQDQLVGRFAERVRASSVPQ